jgi:hypothetical protein
MITPLAHLLVGALNALAHPVESVAGPCSHASDLLAMAHHATAQLREHEVGAGEPVHVRIGTGPLILHLCSAFGRPAP